MINIIFGAGASFGSGKCTPYCPPLGNNLFENLCEIDGHFKQLPEELKQIFLSKGFESGMAAIDDDSRIINPLQKEVACYLSKFKTTPENAYVRLFNKLKRHISKIAITTLNYDILIEQALSYHGFNIDYNSTNNGITLLKPHGSSNFLPQLPSGMVLQGNTFKNCSSFMEGLKTIAAESHEAVKDWCKDPRNSDLSPVLSIYSKEKRVVINKRLISEIQNKYNEINEQAKLLVLVGIKYIPHDNHIWDSIGESNAKIVVVDPYPEATEKWLKEKGKLQNSVVFKKSFDAAVWDLTKVMHKSIYNAI